MRPASPRPTLRHGNITCLPSPTPRHSNTTCLPSPRPAPAPSTIPPTRSAKAAVANMEFVQFHPTSLYAPACPGYGVNGAGALGGRSFLITEAVRGEGGMLFNLGERGTFEAFQGFWVACDHHRGRER